MLGINNVFVFVLLFLLCSNSNNIVTIKKETSKKYRYSGEKIMVIKAIKQDTTTKKLIMYAKEETIE